MEGLEEYEREVRFRLEALDPETEVEFEYKDEIDETVTPEKALELLDENMASRPETPERGASVKDWYLDVDVTEDGSQTEIELEKGTRFPSDIDIDEERDYRLFERPKEPLVRAVVRYGQ